MTSIPLDGEIRDGRHHFTVRVYYEDTDFTGIVYHANYLRYMERARTNYLRLIGADHRALFEATEKEAPGFAFAVYSMNLTFLKPARMDDVLERHRSARGQGRLSHAAPARRARRRASGRGPCPGRLHQRRPRAADPEAVAHRHEGRPGRGPDLAAAGAVAEFGSLAEAWTHYIALMSEIAFALFDTAIGRCAIVWNAYGIAGVGFPEGNEQATRTRLLRRHPAAREASAPHDVRGVMDDIVALLAGSPRDLGYARLDMTGLSDLQRRVYDVARKISAGATLTYGEIAELLGDRLLARGVGEALGHNPFPIIVPCHRVLAAGSKLGGFSAPGGVRTKLRLLEIEGAQPGGPTLFADLPLTAPRRRKH